MDYFGADLCHNSVFMKKSDLFFEYPEELVATEPLRPSRVMHVEVTSHVDSVQTSAQEISWLQLLETIPTGDVLVVNNTQVLKRRIFTDKFEILFLNTTSEDTQVWEVLFPSKSLSIGSVIELPLGKRAQLEKKGRPQLLRMLDPVDEAYFEQVAELPLPPYIQKARQERHNVGADPSWYQTAWAKEPGSLAAPTASLHFSKQDIENLQARGVVVTALTLHVGLGTFLPVTAEDLDQHEMHSEYVQVPVQTWELCQQAKADGRKVWCMGTTAVRAMESLAAGKLNPQSQAYSGWTNLLIQPGFKFQVVDRILTNFHQPESTLLALVAAFSDLQEVKKVYKLAIEKKFRLFSYGDLSVWIKK